MSTRHHILPVVVGAAVLFAVSGYSYFRYIERRVAQRDMAHWAELASKREDGQTLLREIRDRQAQLNDRDSANDATAYVYLGVAVGALGDKGAAIRYYEQGLKLDPQNRLALNNLANAYQDLENWSKAEEYYRKLIAAHPTFVPGYRLLAYLYQYRLGNDERQIKELIDRGLAATNDDPNLLSWMMSYYQERGEGEKAVPYAQRLAEQLNKQRTPSNEDATATPNSLKLEGQQP